LTLRTLKIVGTAAGLALLLSGCVYDYIQHSDKVAYSAGDAVHANLEAETTNPYKRSALDTGGLGKDGDVMPSQDATSTTTP